MFEFIDQKSQVLDIEFDFCPPIEIINKFGKNLYYVDHIRKECDLDIKFRYIKGYKYRIFRKIFDIVYSETLFPKNKLSNIKKYLDGIYEVLPMSGLCYCAFYLSPDENLEKVLHFRHDGKKKKIASFNYKIPYNYTKNQLKVLSNKWNITVNIDYIHPLGKNYLVLMKK